MMLIYGIGRGGPLWIAPLLVCKSLTMRGRLADSGFWCSSGRAVCSAAADQVWCTPRRLSILQTWFPTFCTCITEPDGGIIDYRQVLIAGRAAWLPLRWAGVTVILLATGYLFFDVEPVFADLMSIACWRYR
jgi:hypothetical protein